MAGIIYRYEAFLMERNQVVDTVHLVQWKMWVNAMRPWRTVNEPAATDTALELITIEGIGPIHNKLEIVEFPPFAMADGPRRFVRIQLIKPRIDTLMFRALKVDLPSFFGIRRFSLIFEGRFFPLAKGECSKADVDIAVFDRGNLLFILLVYAGKVLHFFSWDPFPLRSESVV